jgi:predicted O-methyltransferase YrrM
MDNVLEVKELVKDIDPGASILDMEGKLLYKLAEECKEGVVVEIGSWKGRSTIWLAKGARTKVYAIDPHQGTQTHEYEACENTSNEFMRNIARAGVSGVVVSIAATSEEVVKDWDKPVGLIFIDGDHSYEAVKFDFDNWVPHLVDGGVIALHDTIAYEGPRKVVIDNIFKSREFTNIGMWGQIVYARKGKGSLRRNRLMLVYKYLYEVMFSLIKKVPRRVKEIIKNV